MNIISNIKKHNLLNEILNKKRILNQFKSEDETLSRLLLLLRSNKNINTNNLSSNSFDSKDVINEGNLDYTNQLIDEVTNEIINENNDINVNDNNNTNNHLHINEIVDDDNKLFMSASVLINNNPTNTNNIISNNTTTSIYNITTTIATPNSTSNPTGLNDISDFKKYFHLPLQQVAKQLGMCNTSFKILCRKFDIKRWPYRQLNTLTNSIESLKIAFNQENINSYDKLYLENQIIKLQEEFNQIIEDSANPSNEMKRKPINNKRLYNPLDIIKSNQITLPLLNKKKRLQPAAKIYPLMEPDICNDFTFDLVPSSVTTLPSTLNKKQCYLPTLVEQLPPTPDPVYIIDEDIIDSSVDFLVDDDDEDNNNTKDSVIYTEASNMSDTLLSTTDRDDVTITMRGIMNLNKVDILTK